MPKMFFLNLPISDLARSQAFYEALGASVNPMFSDETVKCMVFSDTLFAMIHTPASYRRFTQRPIVDAHATSAALFSISYDAKGDVDAVLDAAVKAGGTGDPNPKQDLGFMYQRSVEDPDGHVWEITWMDPAAAETGPTEHAAA
jgi:predicted lactoylglutathione lyase